VTGALAIVPARAGSRRVPGKNLARLDGRTLVRRALETAVAAGCFADVCLSSDDAAILAEGEGLDGVTTLRRPPALATAQARSFDVVRHAIGEMEGRTGRRYDPVCVVQCTSPFTEPGDLRATLDLLADHPDADSAVTVAPVDMVHHPIKLKRLDGIRLVPFLAPDAMTPSQDLPALYARNGCAYASRRRLIESGTFVAEDALAHVMPPERSVDVDTPLDLEFARFLAGRRRDAG
jgi:CMP-N-acetylneuraminic acid synthetase